MAGDIFTGDFTDFANANPLKKPISILPDNPDNIGAPIDDSSGTSIQGTPFEQSQPPLQEDSSSSAQSPAADSSQATPDSSQDPAEDPNRLLTPYEVYTQAIEALKSNKEGPEAFQILDDLYARADHSNPKMSEVFAKLGANFKQIYGVEHTPDVAHMLPPMRIPGDIPTDKKLEIIDSWVDQAKAHIANTQGSEYDYNKLTIDPQIEAFADYRKRELQAKDKYPVDEHNQLKKEGWLSDKITRFKEGATADVLKSIGLTSAAKAVDGYFVDNPAYDGTFGANTARLAGFGGGAVALAAITSGVTSALGGAVEGAAVLSKINQTSKLAQAMHATASVISGAAPIAGEVASGASMVNSVMQDVYEKVYQETGSTTQATRAQLMSLPGATVGFVFNYFIASKLVGPMFAKAKTKSEQIEAIVGGIEAQSTPEGLASLKKILLSAKSTAATRLKNMAIGSVEGGAAGAVAIPAMNTMINKAVTSSIPNEQTSSLTDVKGEDALMGLISGAMLGGAGGLAGKPQGLHPETSRLVDAALERIAQKEKDMAQEAFVAGTRGEVPKDSSISRPPQEAVTTEQTQAAQDIKEIEKAAQAAQDKFVANQDKTTKERAPIEAELTDLFNQKDVIELTSEMADKARTVELTPEMEVIDQKIAAKIDELHATEATAQIRTNEDKIKDPATSIESQKESMRHNETLANVAKELTAKPDPEAEKQKFKSAIEVATSDRPKIIRLGDRHSATISKTPEGDISLTSSTRNKDFSGFIFTDERMRNFLKAADEAGIPNVRFPLHEEAKTGMPIQVAIDRYQKFGFEVNPENPNEMVRSLQEVAPEIAKPETSAPANEPDLKASALVTTEPTTPAQTRVDQLRKKMEANSTEMIKLETKSRDLMDARFKNLGTDLGRRQEAQSKELMDQHVALQKENAGLMDQSGKLLGIKPVETAKPETTFKTERGSTYTFEDGKTTRNKSEHPEHLPGDSGLKEQSAATYFVSPEDARRVGMWQTQSGGGKRLHINGDEIVLTSPHPKTGVRGSDERIKILSREPQVGLSPVELFKPANDGSGSFKGSHPGNKITEISGKESAPISAAPESAFKESKTFTDIQDQRQFSLDNPESDVKPALSEVTNEELIKQEAGQYVATTQAERDFHRDNFFKAHPDKEALATDILNPEGSQPLSSLSEDVKLQVVADIFKHLDNEAEKAYLENDRERAAELKLKATDFYNYVASPLITSAGKVLQAMKGARDILDIAKGKPEYIVNNILDILNRGKEPLDNKTRTEILAINKEGDAITRDEHAVANAAIDLKGTSDEINRLKDSIDSHKSDLQDAKDKLAALEKERAKLEAKDAKLNADTPGKIAELEKQIEAAKERLTEAKFNLGRSQDRFNDLSEKLKNDIKGFKALEKALINRRKALSKRELDLRKKRAVAKQKLSFSDLPKDVKEEMARLAEKFQEAPDGFIRQHWAAEMYQLGLEHSGGLSALEMGNMAWYANAVSGISTQGINIYGNSLSLIGRGAAVTASQRGTFIPFMQGVANGIMRGGSEFKTSAFEGRMGRNDKFSFSRTTLEQLTPQSVLEALFSTKGKRGLEQRLKEAGTSLKEHPILETITGFGAAKAMGRGLRAFDAWFYRTAVDGMAAAQLSKMGKISGKSKTEIAAYIADHLYLSSEKGKEALKQANGDLFQSFGKDNYTKNDVVRRAIEIMDANLPQEVLAEADRFGSLVTFTDEPHGMFGQFANVLTSAVSKISTPEIPTKYGTIPKLYPLQPFFPFIRIAANVGEFALEFSPAGLVKSALPEYAARRGELVASAMIGSTLASVVSSLAYSYMDDKDPYIAIFGGWDALSPERQQAERAKGNRPYTVKIGDHSIPYSETPLFWLGAIGSYMDNQRWNSKFDQKTDFETVKMVIAGVAGSMGNQSVLSGLSNLADIATGKSDPTRTAASYLSVYEPGGSLAKDIGRLFDPNVQNIEDKRSATSSFLGSLFRGYPVIGAMANKPALNGFGEVIQLEFPEETFGLIKRTIGTWRKSDLEPEWKFLAENGLNFSGFKGTMEIGVGGADHKASTQEFKESRESKLGRAYFNVLTPEEKYRYIQIAGPQIKEAIAGIMADTNNGAGVSKGELQGKVDAAVEKVKRKSKADFISELMSE